MWKLPYASRRAPIINPFMTSLFLMKILSNLSNSTGFASRLFIFSRFYYFTDLEITMQGKLNAVSLFSGGGGLDLGLAAAGFDILFENDIDQQSCITLESNGQIAKQHGLSGFENTIVIPEDIRNLSGQTILSQVKLSRGSIDVLAGGPPCQAFSVFGKRLGTEDQRGQLSFEYRRVLGELAPKVFLFENVTGLLTVEKGETYKRLIQELSTPASDVSYQIFPNRVNARDYCVPQSRDRVIIVGIRGDIALENNISSFTIPPTSTGSNNEDLPAWRTVENALYGLPELIPNGATIKSVPNHHGRRHSQRIIDRYSSLLPGERDPKTRINRLDLTKPSFTIVVGSDHGGGKGHVHPTQPREVTPRESARIQSFPDWWRFTGSVRDEIRQVGNAVPALLGFSIGNAIRTQIFKRKGVPMQTAISSLGQEHLFLDCH